MLLKEQDEVLISELLNELENFVNTKKPHHYINFNQKLNDIFREKSNEFIDYTIELLTDIHENEELLRIFDMNVRDLMEFKEDEEKVSIVFAIPYLIYNYKSMEIPEFLRKKNYFDNRLFKVKVKLEQELKKQIPTEFGVNLKLHDSFVNMNDMYRKYKKLYFLKDDIKNENTAKNSLLYDKKNERIISEKQNNLKFIIGVLEFNKFENIEQVFENSFYDHNSIFSNLKNDFENLLINQHLESEQFLLLKPRSLMNALEEGEVEFHYHMLVNVISDVFLHRKKEEVKSKILYSNDRSSIQVCFMDVDKKSPHYKQVVYRIDISEYIINFEEELNIIISILNELDIRFDVIEQN